MLLTGEEWWQIIKEMHPENQILFEKRDTDLPEEFRVCGQWRRTRFTQIENYQCKIEWALYVNDL